MTDREPLLELVEVDAHYGPALILQAVSLQARAGETIALIGRNGAGKTTTLRTVMGYVHASAGRIRFDGDDIAGLPTHRIAAAGIGYVPEDRRIFASLTVAENLEAGRRPARAGQAPWTLARVFALFPALEPLLGRSGGTLSGGEQQMLTIARTLLGNPSLLLLDEPSEGLAPRVVGELRDAVQTLRSDGLTILLAEQNLRFAMAVSDRAYVLEKGRVRHEGAIAALLDDEAVRRAYLTL